MSVANPVYRFKFSDVCLISLMDFAEVHASDDPEDFRKAWDDWKKDNGALMEREKRRLTTMGYRGVIADKMYRSVRYYFKNKKETGRKTEEEKKERPRYVPLDKILLGYMDRHVKEVAFEEGYKPAHAYNNYISNSAYNMHVNAEKARLATIGLSEVAMEAKIKKTYKNRYFIQQKKR